MIKINYVKKIQYQNKKLQLNFMKGIYSPIRNLQFKESRERRMPTILEENIQNKIKQTDRINGRLEQENLILKRRLHQSMAAEQDVQLLMQENNRLKHQIENISYKNNDNYQSVYNNEFKNQQIQLNLNEEVLILSKQNQKLKYELSAMNAELQNSIRQNQINKENYQSEINYLKLENRDLKKRLITTEQDQVSEIDKLKKKYTSLHLDDSESLKFTHSQQIKFLIDEMDKLKNLLNDKTTDLQLQFQERKELKQRFDIELGNKITEINQIKNQLQVLQTQKDKQIKNLTAKRQLEKSRAAGIIGSSKQNTTYLDKQIKKLSDQLKQKNFQLQNLNKLYLNEKKKNEESIKLFNDKTVSLKREHEESLRQKINQFEKRQNILKQEILDKKKKQTQLYLNIDKLEKQIQVLKHQYQLLKTASHEQETQIRGLKLINEQQREEHMKQIGKVMSQKLKRRSSRMLSSQRSLNQSLKDSNLVEIQQPNLVGGLIDNLPTVKQEVYLRESNRESMEKSIDDPNEQNDIENVIAHFKNTIDELKISQNTELEILRIQKKKLEKKLQEKNQQYEDILKRFAPLVKIRAGQKSLEQDRRQRIEKHWKADIALLQVLLQKHKIQILL